MRQRLAFLFSLLILIACQDAPPYFLSLEKPLYNGHTWCGRPFWNATLVASAQDSSIYSFELNKWYGEPAQTCLPFYKPFGGKLVAKENQIDFLPDTALGLNRNSLVLLRFDLPHNTIMDSLYNQKWGCMTYTKYIAQFAFYEDTIYKFEWTNLVNTWETETQITDVYFSKSRGLVGINQRCRKFGGQQICAMGFIPDGVNINHNPLCPDCGQKW